MKKLAMRALYATLFAGGLTLLGAGVAHASETGGDDGILSGTQAAISIELPVTVSGNGISLIGDSSSSDAATEVATPAAGDTSDPAAVTSGDDGVGSGTQALVDVSIPVTIGGNAISVVGDSSSDGVSTTTAPAAAAADATNAETSGSDSLLGGTQALVDVGVPVTIGGNAVSVIGDSQSSDASTAVAPSTGAGDGSTAETSGEDGILGGTQAIIGGTVPVTVGGNAVSVIGDSRSSGAETVVQQGTGGGSATTDGEDGLLGGTQLLPDLSLPVTVGGNAISVIGDSETERPTTIVDPTDPTDPTGPTDPTNPTDPTDPTNPSDPGQPGEPGEPGEPGSGDDESSVASSGGSVIAAGSTLASTGADLGGVGLAALALIGGLLLLSLRRFALRR